MFRFSVQVKSFDRLTEAQQALGIPLMRIGEMLLTRIRDRVGGGKAPVGMWRPLGSDAEERGADAKARWWVPPESPQPGGFMQRITSGEFAGWAVYANYRQYLDLLPDGRTRKWTKSGAFWRATGVRYINAKRVKVSAYGTHRSRSGTVAYAQIGYLAGRNERYGVFEPSSAERELARDMAAELLTQSLRKAIGQVAQAQDIERRARGLERRSSRLLSGG